MLSDAAARLRQNPEALATAVLQSYWDGVLPVDPQKIARKLGVHIVQRSAWDEGWRGKSGHFHFDGTVPVIEYNTDEIETRQRFTIAHELGHFLLGDRDAPRDGPASFGSGQREPREIRANRFAAALLMPAAAVRTLFLSGRCDSVDSLAAQFKVSKAAMGFRLANLRLVAA